MRVFFTLMPWSNENKSCVRVYERKLRSESLCVMCEHRRTGLEIFGGGRRTRVCPTRARTSRGVRGLLPRKILKNRASNAISCVLVWVFMHGASDK